MVPPFGDDARQVSDSHVVETRLALSARHVWVLGNEGHRPGDKEALMLMQAIASIVHLFGNRDDAWEYGEDDDLTGWIAPSTDWAA
jgi:hypothetical protein